MKIQVLFLKKKDWLGKLIMKATDGNYSHCGFLLSDLIVADTDFQRDFGLRLLPWNKSDFEVVDLRINDTQNTKLIRWIIEHNKAKYDNWANIRYLLRRFLRLKDDDQRLNCTESVIDALVYCGYLNPMYKTEVLSPTDVMEILRKRE